MLQSNFYLHLLMAIFPVCVCALVFSSYKDITHVGLGPALIKYGFFLIWLLYFAMYNAHPCFCNIIRSIIIPLLYPRYVIIIPMYNAHPYFSLKYLGKKYTLFTAWYSTSVRTLFPNKVTFSCWALGFQSVFCGDTTQPTQCLFHSYSSSLFPGVNCYPLPLASSIPLQQW